MLKLKIPPVAVTLIFAVFMKLIDLWIIAGEFVLHYRFIFSILFFLTAAFIGLAGVMEFVRHSTSVNPHKPENANSLVIRGVFRFSRNPMYLALLLLLISWGFYLGNYFTFSMFPLFVWYMNENQVKPEEEVMRKKFGEEFREYSLNTRRWL